MPSSFEALHDQTRPLALLDDHAPRQSPTGAALAAVLLIVLPLLAAVLL
jgi:hypothetical protein